MSQKYNKLSDHLNRGKLIRAKKKLTENNDLKMLLYIYRKEKEYKLEIEVINPKLPMESEPVEEHEFPFADLDRLFYFLEEKYEITIADFIRI